LLLRGSQQLIIRRAQPWGWFHTPGIVYDNDTPSRDHIHTVVRTPNGNDYGKDGHSSRYRQD
jgi:rhodanese-related sulfurtransferase